MADLHHPSTPNSSAPEQGLLAFIPQIMPPPSPSGAERDANLTPHDFIACHGVLNTDRARRKY